MDRRAARGHRDRRRDGRRPPERHRRRARLLANALDSAAGPDRNADTGFDVRLHDEPLTSLRPDVTVYRADTLDITPARPEHVLLVVEVVPPGPQATGRPHRHGRAGIPFFWRVEQAATGAPLVHTYVLDPAAGRYRDGEIFTGVVKVSAPFPAKIDLHRIRPGAVVSGERGSYWARLSRRPRAIMDG
ncbi:Uma2 family endonuclease [Symbioplanes lichenis]|uniref:Uma2 family endonuclease n=1 Tax=Symbioplanes lichenis TaxID=1629072 RepID=UPI00273A34FE|nr:Uma2 family endonuclease [Actinoplanes lichenis]